jgi:ribosome-associated heat shock protein Hsp15
MSDDRLRIDKWLWFARFLKSRSQAADLVEQGEVTVNGTVVTRTAHALKPGDVVGFALGRRRRLVRVLALGERRGPAPEAQALYEELPAPALLDD